jgi:hypothetical protein
MVVSYFFRPILLNIARNVHNGKKNNSTLFLILFKIKDNEVIRVKIFLSFFNSAWLFDLPGLPNLTVHIIEHREVKSVAILCLFPMVFETETF